MVPVVFIAALAVVGAYQIAPSFAAPSLTCDATVEYGSPVSCSASGGHALGWPDGAETPIDASHTPRFVGESKIVLLSDAGTVLSAATIRIEPDISIECEDSDDDPKKIFELEHTELRETGWDYVFTDAATGDRVTPGDPRHPNGGAEDGLERIVLGETQATRACRLISQAGEDLDGEYQMTIVSPWEEAQTTPMRLIGPASKTHWAGTQPAELTGTVTVNNITASERVDVYQSGCS